MKIEDVVIVGGGPVGLFLGLCLHHRGIPFTIIEKRTEIISGSRSLGIHPVSLELFSEIGIVDEFVNTGIKVQRGFAHSGKEILGSINFESCPKPFNYILLLAQSESERILKERILEVAPGSLIEGAEVVTMDQEDDFVRIDIKKNGETHAFETGYLVGCDGKNSFVRQSLGIQFKGEKYPDTYVMGDFQDTTSFENDAVVYLPKDGLIECFPLPNKMRRWVVKTDKFIQESSPNILSELIQGLIRLYFVYF